MAGTTWHEFSDNTVIWASEKNDNFDWIEGDIVPMNAGTKVDATYDLGTSSYRWRDGRFSRYVYIDDSLITKGPWLDVRAYGAVGDGTTNDASALMAAITALSSTSGIIYFPPSGTYKLADTDADGIAILLNGKSKITFKGNKTKIIISDAIEMFTLTNCQNITFQGLCLEDTYGSSGTYQLSKGVYLKGDATNASCNYILIDDCEFEGFKYGIYGQGNIAGVPSASIREITINRCKFYDNYNGIAVLGYHTNSCYNWTITKSRFDNNSKWGVWMSSTETGGTANSYHVQTLKFNECDFLSTVDEHGVYVQGRNHSFINCTFLNNNSAGLRCTINPGLRVIGCHFEGNGKNSGAGGYTTAALMMGNNRQPNYTETYEGIGTIIEGNRFYDNFYGIHVYCDKLRTKIIGNDIANNDSDGIKIQQMPKSVITGNTIVGNGGSGINMTNYGAGGYGAGKSDWIIVQNNIIMDNTNYGIFVDTNASWYWKIKDNICENNTSGEYSVQGSNRAGGFDSILTFSGSVADAASATTTLNLEGVNGITKFRAYTDLIVKGIILMMEGDSPSGGQLTVQPQKDGTNIGTGPTFNSTDAKIYPDETGLGYVGVTGNISCHVVTSTDWSNGTAAMNVTVHLVLGTPLHTHYQ